MDTVENPKLPGGICSKNREIILLVLLTTTKIQSKRFPAGPCRVLFLPKLPKVNRSGSQVHSLPLVQSIATGIEGLDCSKSSPYKLCTASPIKLYHERVSRTGSVFPIFWGYKLIDKAVQSLYGLVLQSRPRSIPVAIGCTAVLWYVA